LAFTFKTLADAILLRNHMIERMERAEVESDAKLRQRELTFVVIGGGLVGVEVLGELTAFMDDIPRYYPRIRRDEIRLYLLEASPRIMPELSGKLTDYSTRVLSRRAGVSIRTGTSVERITPGPSLSEGRNSRGFDHRSVGRHNALADSCGASDRKGQARQDRG
jgi:NADH dehydrogenase